LRPLVALQVADEIPRDAPAERRPSVIRFAPQFALGGGSRLVTCDLADIEQLQPLGPRQVAWLRRLERPPAPGAIRPPVPMQLRVLDLDRGAVGLPVLPHGLEERGAVCLGQ